MHGSFEPWICGRRDRHRILHYSWSVSIAWRIGIGKLERATARHAEREAASGKHQRLYMPLDRRSPPVSGSRALRGSPRQDAATAELAARTTGPAPQRLDQSAGNRRRPKPDVSPKTPPLRCLPRPGPSE